MYLKLKEEIKEKVWNKAKTIDNENPDKYRIDKYGNWIAKSEFEQDSSLLGWKISKINPELQEELDNLEPLFWKNVPYFK